MRFLDGSLKLIMILSTLVLALVTFIQVIMRFVFEDPVGWGQDIIRLSFIYLVFFGGAYCLKIGDHLNIDIIFSFFSEKFNKYLHLFLNIILLAFFIFLLYYGIDFAKSGFSQVAPYTGLPMFYYYLPIPVSAFILIVYDIQIIIKNIKDIIILRGITK